MASGVVPRIASLHLHPVKGMRALDVASASVELKGFAGDRRYVVVDRDGMFLTQRSHPVLATIRAEISPDGLILSAEGVGERRVETPSSARRRRIQVWNSHVEAAIGDDAANAFLSNLLGEEVALAFMDRAAERLKISDWTGAPVPVSFADAFPLLVATTASLGALNAEIARGGGAPVPMARFRPNVVIDCNDPWAEDLWAAIRIGDVVLDLVKPSDRCIVTTTDQESGARMGKEPLKTLARLRRSADPRIDGVLFGWNAVPRSPGPIKVGEPVEIVKTRAERWPLRLQ